MSRCLFLSLITFLGTSTASADDMPPRFERDVLPILRAHCLKCHGAAQRKGGLSLRTPSAMRKGGDSGPAIVAQNAKESLIIEQIESGQMPPAKAEKLSEAELAKLKAWIAAGSPADDTTADEPDEGEPVHWAFVPPKRPVVADATDTSRVRNPIDAFVVAKLEAAGLQLSPEADKTTLIRRATLDLWGLPPTQEEVETFLADTASDAYERLIDRLLQSPRYGERWARHWLDLAGYADSEGILAADHVRSASWRYRDWVIRAFNADMPYDRFLREQIAGDELSDYWSIYKTKEALPPEVVESLVATGYLRCASDTSRPDFVNIKNAQGYYYQTLEDTVKIVSSSTLGLTLECAKCHSHKYDPITQSEYYQVQAVFMSGYRPGQWIAQVERKRVEATEAQEGRARAHNAGITESVARDQAAIETINKGFSDRRFARRLATLPEAIREDVRSAFETDTAKRNEVQRYLFGKFSAELRPDPPALAAFIAEESPRERDLIKALEKSIADHQQQVRDFPEIRAFYDLPGEPKTPILQRGDYLHPGPEVAPGVPQGLATPRPFRWSPPPKDAPSSGRRLAFAEWLTQPGHPLTARVLVNRLWLHHFGEGIVATPDNFGIKGAAPSHPELLDWMADEFIAQGWSIKAMHRLMMNSSAYRQSSRYEPERHAEARTVDPDDRLLWRQRIRRLDAEALRDSVLNVAGTLNLAMGGPPVTMVAHADGEVVEPQGPEGFRRSIYLQVRRSQPLTLLQVFDQPVMETNCTRRPVSTVSSQALTMLNGDFLILQAERFADRSIRESPADPTAQAVRLAFGREATDAEQALFGRHLTEQVERNGRKFHDALADICQMLLSSNEFAYVD